MIESEVLAEIDKQIEWLTRESFTVDFDLTNRQDGGVGVVVDHSVAMHALLFVKRVVLRAGASPGAQWEGDLSSEHPNRCKLRDNLLYADIFNDDGSCRPAWRCHKRAGHDGPCSSHNDCGVMNGGVVCGKLPGHAGLHQWATEIQGASPGASTRSCEICGRPISNDEHIAVCGPCLIP